MHAAPLVLCALAVACGTPAVPVEPTLPAEPPVPTELRARVLGGGRVHTCAITDRGSYCWGAGQAGQLAGDEDRLRPQRMPLRGHRLVVGGDTTCIDERCWGAHEGTPNGVPAIVRDLLCTLRGEALHCGDVLVPTEGLEDMARGLGSTLLHDAAGLRWVPDEEEERRELVEPQMLATGDTPRGAICAGVAHACAVVDDETLCWDVEGEQRSVSVSPTPSLLECGWYHTCAVHGGRVSCWGANAMGQLGVADADGSEPVTVPRIDSATDVVAGYGHTCALTDEGRIFCWGFNAYGQLGDGTIESRAEPRPVLAPE